MNKKEDWSICQVLLFIALCDLLGFLIVVGIPIGIVLFINPK